MEGPRKPIIVDGGQATRAVHSLRRYPSTMPLSFLPGTPLLQEQLEMKIETQRERERLKPSNPNIRLAEGGLLLTTARFALGIGFNEEGGGGGLCFFSTATNGLHKTCCSQSSDQKLRVLGNRPADLWLGYVNGLLVKRSGFQQPSSRTTYQESTLCSSIGEK